jgi:hypothetical protein
MRPQCDPGANADGRSQNEEGLSEAGQSHDLSKAENRKQKVEIEAAG